ncbi:MAG TPA: heme biosynthesis HemY N-terminal domain-containing protein [Roseiarcus sp.]|nr:heme biosynthesis HemY N-terminal domain-containing protein [Roseiarcus sp.]
MVRLVIFLGLLCLAALGLAWLADHPGQVELTWGGYHIQASAMVALGFVVALAIVIAILWGIIRFVFRIPSLVTLARRARRREKGMAALSRGMIAVGSGDARTARRHAAEAHRLIGDEPLTHLLRAQAAQLAGDRAAAEAAFRDMLGKASTHALGLRGLHLEARRRGDHAAAIQYAAEANKHAPLPWAGQAVLDHRAAQGDWAGALATVESNAAAHLIDKPTANRWRAVLKTALAQERAQREPQAALALAQEAVRLAPDLAPAAALVGRLLAAQGDYRRASKIIETSYAKTPHPDLAVTYLRMRPGDSASDRLLRARALARVAPNDPESRLTVARAALEARDFKAAREAIAPLIEAGAPAGRPTRRVCLLMADLEETEGGAPGAAREWLARASRAPHDPAWIAEGIISDVWAPASPSGKLDAFVWRAPDERLSAPAEPPPSRDEPAMIEPAMIEHVAEAPEPSVAKAESLPAEPPPSTTIEKTPGSAARRSVIDLPPPNPPDDPGAEGAPEKPRFRLFS